MAELGAQSGSLWIVPRPLAREQLERRLEPGQASVVPPARVYCWSDLWRLVRQEAEDGPRWLSPAAARAVFDEAVRRARGEEAVAAIARIIDRTGYQDRLQERFRRWIELERPFKPRGRPKQDDPVEAAELAVFVSYRSLLEELNSDDDAGMSVWASRRLVRSRRFWADADGTGPVVFLDLEDAPPSYWRVLERALETPRSVHVALAHVAGEPQTEVYLASRSARDRLLALGFEETQVEPREGRPAGLSMVERILFERPDSQAARVSTFDGLSIRGGPEGEGENCLVASEVRAILAQGNACRGGAGPLPPVERQLRSAARSSSGLGNPRARRSPHSPAGCTRDLRPAAGDLDPVRAMGD